MQEVVDRHCYIWLLGFKWMTENRVSERFLAQAISHMADLKKLFLVNPFLDISRCFSRSLVYFIVVLHRLFCSILSLVFLYFLIFLIKNALF